MMKSGSSWFSSMVPLACLLVAGCAGETRPSRSPVLSLEAGCSAPEISGKDMDGAFFKLSDYRGKVVLLDFWGDW